jgi:hypothetical protein
MAKLFNRAKMDTTTTGSGTITLGSAVDGYQTFADAGVADSDVVQYVIEDGTSWEIGTGTYSASGTSLTRTPSESSNAGAAISLTGAAEVFITAVADDLNRLQNAGSDIVTVSASGAAVTGNITVTGTVDGVDIATRDNVLTSTTTTANAALPKAGGTMTGAITFAAGQTFDGRDVSADGSKLDGIESGATADQTITAGSGLTGGGTGNVTISHSDTSSQSSVNNSGNTVIQDVTLDTYGHVTGLASTTLSIPAAANNATITLSAGTNLSGGGNFTTNQSPNETITFNMSSAPSVTSVAIGSTVTLQESTDRADLLQITSSTSGWGGLQIRNSSNEGRWSFMTDGSTAGIYDDENNEWHIQMSENAGVTLYHNGVANFTTGATYMEMARNLDMNNYDIYGVDQIFHHGDTNTYMQFHAADQWRVVTGGAERLEVNNSTITSTEPIYAPSFHGSGASLTGDVGPSTAGAVGTYAFLSRASNVTSGSTYAGSGLRFAGIVANHYDDADTAASMTHGTTRSGTWRAMGTVSGVVSDHPYSSTLYKRIS